jgi:putative oxidoreductase
MEEPGGEMDVKKVLFGGAAGAAGSIDFGMFLIRVFTGLSLAFAHGWAKIPPSSKFIAGVGEIGFPFPHVFAWAAGVSEFFGGILLALGLFTRPSAFLIAFTMAVAAFGRHAADPYLRKEPALLFMVVALGFLFMGAGRLSIDALIVPRKTRGF